MHTSMFCQRPWTAPSNFGAERSVRDLAQELRSFEDLSDGGVRRLRRVPVFASKVRAYCLALERRSATDVVQNLWLRSLIGDV